MCLRDDLLDSILYGGLAWHSHKFLPWFVNVTNVIKHPHRQTILVIILECVIRLEDELIENVRRGNSIGEQDNDRIGTSWECDKCIEPFNLVVTL